MFTRFYRGAHGRGLGLRHRIFTQAVNAMRVQSGLIAVSFGVADKKGIVAILRICSS